MAACSSARHWRRSLALFRRGPRDAVGRGALGAWRVALEGPLDLATWCDVAAQSHVEAEKLNRMAVEVLEKRLRRAQNWRFRAFFRAFFGSFQRSFACF